MKSIWPWSTTVAGREFLFWRVCVPFRAVVYGLFHAGYIPMALARLAALIAAILMWWRLGGVQWWDRRVDAVLSTLIVFAPSVAIPWLLMTSLGYGVVKAMGSTFC